MILACLAFVLTLQASPPPSNRSNQQQPSDQNQEAPAQTPPQVSITAPNNQNNSRAEGEGSQSQAQNRPQKPRWWDVTWATWGLVVIGFFGTIAAIWTLTILNRQTLALLSGTCAWVIVEVEWIDGRPPLSYVDTHEGTQTTLCVDVICKNYGKTPAWITKKFWEFLIERRRESGYHTMDRTPAYDYELESIAADKDSRHAIQIACRGRIEQGRIGIFWGIVDYKDVFGRTRHARFGYGIRPDGNLDCLSEIPSYVHT